MESRAAFKRDLSEVGEGPTGIPAGSRATRHQEPVTSYTGQVRVEEQMDKGAAPQRGDM